MTFQPENEEFSFSTGRTMYANRGIVGLSPELEVFEGYDGGAEILKNIEARELADYMIRQWQLYKEKHYDSTNS